MQLSAPPRAAPVRRRLLEAMADIASQRGYAGASVSRVIRHADVSRATFYRHFSGREQCFQAVYRPLVECSRRLIAPDAEPLAARPRIVIDALLAGASDQPEAAQLLLVDALGAPAAVRRRHEALIESLERAVEDFLAAQARTPRPLQIPAAALLGGVAGVLSVRILAGEDALLRAQADDLLAWLDSYRLPASHDRPPRCPPRLPAFPEAPVAESLDTLLPRGAAALPTSVAADVRRRRIVLATARLCAAEGYAGTTVSAILAAARVPRAAFYAHFGGKREAFDAAQSLAMRESMAAAASDYLVPAPWPRRVWRALEALLAYFARHPDLAWICLVEAYAAGPEAVRHRHDHLMAFGLFLEDGYRQSAATPPPPRLFSEAIALAILGLMRGQVVAGRTAEMLALLPDCAYTALAPFIGPAAALELVEAEVAATAEAAR